MSTSTNAAIAKLQADFAQFSTDFTALTGAVSSFVTAAEAVFASLTSGSTGTVLSPADSAALTALDTSLETLDASAKAANASISAVTVPPVAPPAA